MIIRPEKPDDYAAIRQVNQAAFAAHPYSKQTEHLIVDALRAAQALSVSLVAEIDGQVVGHIAFSPAKIEDEESHWSLLGPVAVLPPFQRRGIGRQLIEQGLAAIRTLGAHGCVLVGEPDFYCRFGFRHNPALVMEGIPPENFLNFLCLPITDDGVRGRVSHHPAFLVSA